MLQQDDESRKMIIAWRDLQMNHPDLYHMLCDVFELMEIRKQIAVLKEGIVIEIRTKEVEKYLKGFYQRIEQLKLDRIIDIRSEIQDAFSQHIEKDHCQACSMNNPLDL